MKEITSKGKTKPKESGIYESLYRFQVLYLILVILFGGLIYFPFMMDATLLPREWGMALIISLFTAFLIKRKDLASKMPNHNFIFLPSIIILLGLVLWMGISMLYAPNASEVFQETMKHLLILAFLVFTTWLIQTGEKGSTRIIKLVSIYAAVASLSGIIQYTYAFHDTAIDTVNIYKVTGLFSHRNLFSEALFLTLPFSILGILQFQGRWKFFCLIITILTLILNILLLTRSVWVSLTLTLLFAFILIFLNRKTLQISQVIIKGMLYGLIAGILLISLTVLIFIQLSSAQPFRERIKDMTQTRYGTTQTRMLLWNRSLEMYRDHKIIGTGSGNWKIRIPAYGIHHKLDGESNMRIQRPHNDFLLILTENGLVGLFLYISFLGMIFYSVIRNIPRIPSYKDKWLLIISLTGISSYLIISFFSFPRERIEHNLLFFLLISFTLVIHQKHFGKSSKEPLISRQILLIILLIASILALITSSIRIYGEFHIRKAFQSMKVQQHEQVITEIEKSYSILYTIDPFSTPVLWYKGMAQYQTGKIAAAKKSFDLAYRHNPWHGHVLTSLAILHEEGHDTVAAMVKYREALAYNPKYKTARLRYLYLLLELEAYTEAVQQLKPLRTISNDPYFIEYSMRAGKGRMKTFINQLNEPLLSTFPQIEDESWIRHILNLTISTELPFELLAIDNILETPVGGIMPDEFEKQRIRKKAEEELINQGLRLP